ncbi:MAG: metallophosphoesterase family protein [Bacteroidales bacterium]|nr:metallophosphoesterase family protein [Bacteroidales bacterium]
MAFIGLLSDTHGYLHPRVFDFFNPCHEVWHAGDIGSNVVERLAGFKPLKAVYGNIDDAAIRAQCSEELHFTIDELKVYLTHIAGYPGKYNTKVRKKIKLIKPQLLVAGHSHILRVQYDEQSKLLYINPGAAGLYGIHQKITLIRFHIDGVNIHDLEVYETEKQALT